MAEKFVNIDDININLIDSVNPFQRAFEVMSKSVTPSVLRIISDAIAATRVEITEEEALAAWPRIQSWAKVNGRRPSVRSEDPIEKRYAEALLFLQREKQRHENEQRQRASRPDQGDPEGPLGGEGHDASDEQNSLHLEGGSRPWARRLGQLARMNGGWHPEGGGEVMSAVALGAARDLLRLADESGIALAAAIFPLENGGVHVEWSSPERVTSFEISPDGIYEFFDLELASRLVAQESTSTLGRACELLEAALHE